MIYEVTIKDKFQPYPLTRIYFGVEDNALKMVEYASELGYPVFVTARTTAEASKLRSAAEEDRAMGFVVAAALHRSKQR